MPLRGPRHVHLRQAEYLRRSLKHNIGLGRTDLDRGNCVGAYYTMTNVQRMYGEWQGAMAAAGVERPDVKPGLLANDFVVAVERACVIDRHRKGPPRLRLAGAKRKRKK